MVQLNLKAREMSLKIVYYGPALSGKTTNLQQIHLGLEEEMRGRLMSLDTKNDRTLFFDLLPVKFETKSGFTVKLKLFTVPGQVIHNSTRKLVLQGADAVAFIADSQVDQWKNNLESFRNLRENLKVNGFDPDAVPLVVQFNKRDLPDVIDIEQVKKVWEKKGVPIYPASALNRDGVLETLGCLIELTFASLDKKHNLQDKFGIKADEFLVKIMGTLKSKYPMDSNVFLDPSLDITLRDLLDLATLTELAQKILNVQGIGLILFSPEKDILLDTLKSSFDRQEILKIRPKRGEQKMFAGANQESVAILPVIHEMDAVGFLVIGPFSKERTPQEIKNLNDYFITLVEVIVFTSMKRHLTNVAHIASITESYKDLEKANRELQVSFEKLKEIDQMKSNFLAVVSHELRTPLTSVIGYSEMLLEGIGGSLTEGQRGYVNVIMEKADQLLNLIKEILNLSKIEAGRIQVSRKAASPREIAQIAYETILPMAEKKGLKVRLDLSANLPVSALLDAEKLLQVFNNLLSNAVKFTNQGGNIKFSMNLEQAQGEETLLCIVKDSGIGIPEEFLEKIFEKFFQVDNTSTRAFGGTGLGLAIARSFVEIQGGKIWLESSVEKGTTFFVSIPLEKVQPGDFGAET